MRKKKIHIISGARPNFMKIAPIIRELKKNKSHFDFQLIHTGQHYDKSMSDVFFEELGIPEPDFHLNVGSASHAVQTAKIMMAYEEICLTEKPDVVLVVGDVNSTVACSLVAKKLQIKVAHVEAGLRSGDMSMPEEINRMVTDSISDYFFVTEKSGFDNLINEGKPKQMIHFVGHVMIDNLLFQKEKLGDIETPLSDGFKQEHSEYGVVTLHRPASVDNEKILTGIISALENISSSLPLIFSVHPRTMLTLEQFNIKLPDKIVAMESLPYMEFLNLMKDARIVLTDSGGLQEETTALGVPCVTLRENTERPITITEGTNQLAGVSKKNIISIAKELLSKPASLTSGVPELWDGKAAERIVEILKEDK